MVQKQTMLVPSDKSGIWLVRTIHTYSKLGGLQLLGMFGKIAVRETRPSLNYKKHTYKDVLIRAYASSRRPSGIIILSRSSCMLLKKRFTPVGRRVLGFMQVDTKARKLRLSVIKII